MIRNSDGQTLVETALVLPVLGLGVFMALQLIWYCHNMIELQRMAMVAADRITFESQPAFHHWFSSLQGRVTQNPIHLAQEPAPGWLPARGLSTVDASGAWVTVVESMTLWPGLGFSRWLPPLRQEASAPVLLDPALPPEK